ncbi:MAG: 2-C-methyl-D-erythritol 4-phosphate cytidylyltransferase, partial [Eubacterium sp.]|nr:2-C-methyl-D-erythritol 4-phosphate cytidylyltransferase [Eubacterium sp.]
MISDNEKDVAIVLAAGSGKRMQSDVPKQLMEISGMPVLARSLQAF